jgi:hypothetical protein
LPWQPGAGLPAQCRDLPRGGGNAARVPQRLGKPCWEGRARGLRTMKKRRQLPLADRPVPALAFDTCSRRGRDQSARAPSHRDVRAAATWDAGSRARYARRAPALWCCGLATKYVSDPSARRARATPCSAGRTRARPWRATLCPAAAVLLRSEQSGWTDRGFSVARRPSGETHLPRPAAAGSFPRPSKFLRAQGVLYTYSTSRWSQYGTRTSRPTAMLNRSLRSSSIWTCRVRWR